jgi:hypothetical protein
MGNVPESTINLLLSGLMGLFGGLFTIPINALFSWGLKRDEQLYQHKLDMIAKQRELLLQHKLAMERQKNDEIVKLKEIIDRMEQRLENV